MLFQGLRFAILPNSEAWHVEFLSELVIKNGGTTIHLSEDLAVNTIILINNSYVDDNKNLIEEDIFQRELRPYTTNDWEFIKENNLKCVSIKKVSSWLVKGKFEITSEDLVYIKNGTVDLLDTNSSECETDAEVPTVITQVAKTQEPENKNSLLIKALEKLATKNHVEGDQFRTSSYKLAIASIQKCGFPITSGRQSQKELPNIGPSIAKKIETLLTTGTLPGLDVSSDRKEILEYFTKCYGIGSETANRWNLLQVDSFKKTIDKFPEEFIADWQILYGWTYYEDWLKKIPRKECEEYLKILKETLYNIDPQFEVELHGSYRRGVPECGDMDFLFYKPGCDDVGEICKTIEKVALALYNNGYVDCFLQLTPDIFKIFEPSIKERYRTAMIDREDLLQLKVSKPTKKLFLGTRLLAPSCNETGIHKLKLEDLYMSKSNQLNIYPCRRMDFFICKWSEIGSSRIHFTGPSEYNRWIRLVAIEKGMKLTQHGLFKDDLLLESFDEEKIFKLVDVDYVEPELRNVCNVTKKQRK